MVAALEVAAELTNDGRSDAVMVVILPDGGRSYLSKLYNDDWMRSHALLANAASDDRLGDILRPAGDPRDMPPLIVVRTTDLVADAIAAFEAHGISQVPVSEDPEGTALEGLVGSINERSLLDRVYREPAVMSRTIGEIMDASLPMVDVSARLGEVVGALVDGAPAVIAIADDGPVGIVTRSDLLRHFGRSRCVSAP
jgi:cystathionine beta-synthase